MRILILVFSLLIFSFEQAMPFLLNEEGISSENREKSVFLVILGTVQDAGSPHAGCKKTCCRDLFESPDPHRMVVSLGLVDHQNKKSWLFEATPDLPRQMKRLKKYVAVDAAETPDGIFLTHAHIGHYTGLMYLGRESLGAKAVPVYAMPKMKTFLEKNGPWSQLVSLQNIKLMPLQNEQEIQLSSKVKIMPVEVPHRDEFSETVGYIISGPTKKALFIPDIDKWQKWDKDILTQIKAVDYAFLDASFYNGDEINHRDISEIPHPFVIESMDLFKVLQESEKNKVYFIHFNHTNSLLNPDSKQSETVLKNGFNIARFNLVVNL